MKKPFSYEDLKVDENLKVLLEKSFHKIETSTKSDSKLVSGRSNTLNWILALTTLFIGVNIDCYNNICKCNDIYIQKVFIFGIGLFILSIILLILYKYTEESYEKKKNLILDTLHTNQLELMYNPRLLLKHLKENKPFFIISFIQKYREGNFIPSYDKKRKKKFIDMNIKVNKSGTLFSYLYWGIIIIFFINTLITITLIYSTL